MPDSPDKDELNRFRRNKPTADHLALLKQKKEQICDILRELAVADARFVLSEVRRKLDNDEISVDFFIEKP